MVGTPRVVEYGIDGIIVVTLCSFVLPFAGFFPFLLLDFRLSLLLGRARNISSGQKCHFVFFLFLERGECWSASTSSGWLI